MRVALHDSDHTGFPNLALMKISAWHKARGDIVEWWNPMLTFDRVYSSKIFTFTLHRYKLDEPQRWKKPKTIFVCSMADLFGEWVPTEWISAVIEACKAAPQHRYMFLTKNPKRYIKLIQAGILPLNSDRFWYGTTCENPMQEYFFCGKAKTFVSIEPIFAPFTGLNYFDTPPEQRVDWIIVGAETGNRKGKVIPEKSWIDELAYCSAQQKTPIFMKSSLRGIMGVDFVQQFPWDK